MKKYLTSLMLALALCCTAIHASDSGPRIPAPPGDIILTDLTEQMLSNFDHPSVVPASLIGYVYKLQVFDKSGSFPAALIVDESGNKRWLNIETDEPRLFRQVEDAYYHDLRLKFYYITAKAKIKDSKYFIISSLAYEVTEMPQLE